MPHLWGADHSYYCNLGNFYSNEPGEHFKSWADFLAANGDCDFDMNLVFRFDWKEDDPETGESTYKGDPNYRNGKLEVFWMGQRKGLYRFSVVEVCRNDEPAVIEFLTPRWKHLKELWLPLSVLGQTATSDS